LIEAVLTEECLDGGVVWGPAIFEPDCLTTDVGTVSVSVELRETDYGDCELVLIVNGEEIATSAIGAGAEEVCKNVGISGSYEDDEGCIITVTAACKKCGDPCFSSGADCTKGCCFTDIFCLGNNIDSIPFRIDGGPWDGATSFFNGGTPLGTGACGHCGFLESPIELSLNGYACSSGMLTPCSVRLYFAIICERGFIGDSGPDYQGEESEECGNRTRLVVGTDITYFSPASAFNNPPFAENLFAIFHTPVVPLAIIDINVDCTTEGMQGTIDLGSISLKDCNLYSTSDPPNCPGDIPAGCCDLWEQPGGTMVLLPNSELVNV